MNTDMDIDINAVNLFWLKCYVNLLFANLFCFTYYSTYTYLHTIKILIISIFLSIQKPPFHALSSFQK